MTRSADGKAIDWFSCDDEALLEDYRQEVYRMVQSVKLGIVYYPTYARTAADAAPAPAVAGLRSVSPDANTKAA
ncbi:MAG: hypothetical protein WCJ64_13720 [Rhodospirillaceae bacterium]